ncbi:MULTISPECIES: hypothetical protein [unclassified Variovorax]|uniref:hypothetical protein n=1 Tax=unclassified Variovorax TaxID=663243 RepID=UPI0015CDC62B|nr:hypothetical protein [Variovorax sp. YR752]
MNHRRAALVLILSAAASLAAYAQSYLRLEEPPVTTLPEPGHESEDEDAPAPAADSVIDRDIAQLPKVTVLKEEIPEQLAPGRFLAAMVTRVLGATPANMHKEARRWLASPELR